MDAQGAPRGGGEPGDVGQSAGRRRCAHPSPTAQRLVAVRSHTGAGADGRAPGRVGGRVRRCEERRGGAARPLRDGVDRRGVDVVTSVVAYFVADVVGGVVEQPTEPAVAPCEVGARPVFDDPSGVHHGDGLGTFGRRHPVGDDDAGSPGEQA